MKKIWKFLKTNISIVISFIIIFSCLVFGCYHGKFTLEELKKEYVSYFEIIIEAIFLFFVVKEFKMTRKEFEMTRKEFEMTRKQFEWQEEGLKNRYCHEVWHLVGGIFFHNLLFDDFIGEGLEKYKKMIKEIKEKQPEERKKQLEEEINSILEKGKITNPKEENVTENFKEVLNKYKEIVLTIVEELSMDLYYVLKKVRQDVSNISDEDFFKQEKQMMKQLAEHTFLVSTAFYYSRAKWGDKTISSLYKLLININVPKCKKLKIYANQKTN